MEKYKRLNTILGLVTFVFATIVYALTMESSGSFWDCGEFVSGCYKLQVMHPPGAPFFLLLGRIFTLFASDASHVAQTINFMSALSTAGAVMFTFWTVTALARKVVIKDNNYTDASIVTILGAGLIAAGACTFLDSQWFSAVEGEVYAMSQFFMSLIFWAIMKWDAAVEEDKHADRWLVLIAYATGLSIGVHLLALLALPAIALVYYYRKAKKQQFSMWLLAVAAGFVILGIYMKFIISYTQAFLAGFDRLFVNGFGLPFNSGVIFFLIMLVAILVGGIYISHIQKRRLMNIVFLCLTFSYIGYLSYVMVPIRAIANPPINMNRPTDPYSLKSYVDREQYGDRPLLFGPQYNVNPQIDLDRANPYADNGERWVKGEKGYESAGKKIDYNFNSKAKIFFPRMGFWQEDQKKQGYRAWLQPSYNIMSFNGQEESVVKTYPPGQFDQASKDAAEMMKQGGYYYVKDDISFKDNIGFFLKYQIGYMYFRYLMWNFTGRQDDIQGTYANDNGRWISGIPFIDNSGIFFTPEYPQTNLSPTMEANKARNKYYMIPFILGVIGLIYTLFKDERTFFTILVLFGTTGLLQIVYQNEPPIEPRERDYAVASSFLVFTFWIGFGVIAIIDFLKNKAKLPEMPAALGAIVLCLSAPILMGMNGWDDHSRNGRYTARDFAICYLESCAPNAVLFTQGDNDTYPLWYAQEVEGVRPDIRIINLSLLGVDWYIDQLRYKMNDAPALKLSFKPEQYRGNLRDVVRYSADPRIPAGTPVDLKRAMQFVASEDPSSKKIIYTDDKPENYLPSDVMYIDIDTNDARVISMVEPVDKSKIVSRMMWKLPSGTLLKNDLMTLDIVANNLMDRPIYFAVSVSPDSYLGLDRYFQLEGITYRVVPKENASGSPYGAPARVDVMYNNMMKKFKFGGIPDNPKVYLDENVLRMTVNIRGNFGRLGAALLERGDAQKATEVIDYSLKMLPQSKVPFSIFSSSYPEVYYGAGQKEKGRKLAIDMFNSAQAELKYYNGVFDYLLEQAKDNGDYTYLSQLQQGQFMQRNEVRSQLYMMQEMVNTFKKNDPEIAEKYAKDFEAARNYFVRVPMPAQQ
jgi:hypothetical protein